MDVIVTDHHSPRADGALPDAPIVHPRIGGYPCPDLCAAAVAYKLAQALLQAHGEDPRMADEDLDLVALATVADVVPLLGENRRLVRQGLSKLASTRKPGLRALMDVAKVDPSTRRRGRDRLPPRPAPERRRPPLPGRRRPRAAADRGPRARPRGRARAGRQQHGAPRRRDADPLRGRGPGRRARRQPPRYVLASEGWHAGVIGIVAARIAERHHRPCVLIALDGEEGTGSGRSIPGFDLLGGLHAAPDHLQRYGGHRAAAGLTIANADVPAFREAFAAHAASVLTPEDLRPEVRVDAVAPGDALTLGPRRGARAARPVRPGQPRGLACSSPRPCSTTRARWARAATSRSPSARAAPARAACCSGPAAGSPPSPASPSARSSGSSPTTGTAPSSRA